MVVFDVYLEWMLATLECLGFVAFTRYESTPLQRKIVGRRRRRRRKRRNLKKKKSIINIRSFILYILFLVRALIRCIKIGQCSIRKKEKEKKQIMKLLTKGGTPTPKRKVVQFTRSTAGTNQTLFIVHDANEPTWHTHVHWMWLVNQMIVIDSRILSMTKSIRSVSAHTQWYVQFTFTPRH